MHAFPRPTELRLSVEREPVEGTCANCGADSLHAYPVLSEGGWYQVIKCTECLTSKSREKWNLLGPITHLSDTL